MNVKTKASKNQVAKEAVPVVSVFQQEEIRKKAEEILTGLKSSTWRELEVGRKFEKNEKLTFISDDMLIVGCDVGSETHFARGIDTRGRELSRKPFPFSNDAEGFKSAKDWAVSLAAANGKNQIVLGLEPTGHYWFCLPEDITALGTDSFCIIYSKSSKY